jgi:hypothetical protein
MNHVKEGASKEDSLRSVRKNSQTQQNAISLRSGYLDLDLDARLQVKP